MTTKAKQTQGYLPQDVPPFGALVSLGFQHVLTMFPATVFVAILIGFDVGVTLFGSGLATIIAVLGSKGRIPLYYGSSFSYIAPIVAVMGAEWGGIEVAQVGILATAVVNILAGFLIRLTGKERLDKALPPVITGSIAVVIGFSLAKTALEQASVNWPVALITLIATILFSVYLRGKGLLGMLPVLMGAIVGYIAASFFGLVDFTTVREAAWLAMPQFTLPAFSSPNAWKAIIAIAPIAIATIPESTAHLYQMSLYVDKLAEETGRNPLKIKNLVGLNLILDGLGDGVNGLIGGCPGTNYGENNSLMAITRNYSTPALIAAGVIAILLAFVGKLGAIVNTLPVAVTGGLAIYLFGVIGLQGIALMQEEKVDFFNPRQLAIGALVMVTGLGGSYMTGGNIAIFGLELPAIATSAVLGIVLNAVFLLFPEKKANEPVIEAAAEAVAD